MCEIFGFSAEHGQNINEYLRSFYSHCVDHPNGWGYVGFNKNGRTEILCTEPVRADVSERLPGLLDKSLEYPTVLAHIRQATVGRVCLENCHPFARRDCSGRQWTLVHNGTVFSGLEIVPYLSQQVGDTDSEGILLYLVDQIDREIKHVGRELRPFERFQVAERVVGKLARRNKLNLMFFDEEQIYVHTNMQHTLFSKTCEDGILFATSPLSERGWKPMPMTTLFAYRDGKLLYRGENHHNEYVEVMEMPSYEYQI